MTDKKINIVMKVKALSGVLGQAVAILMKSGLRFEKHQLQESDTDTKLLILNVYGCELPDSIEADLRRLDGVLDIIGIHTCKKPESSLNSNDSEQKPKPENDDELLFERLALAHQLAAQWPTEHLMEHLKHWEKLFGKTEIREKELTGLGYEVGEVLASDYPLLETISTLRDALEMIVIPALEGVAECEVKNNGLYVTASVFMQKYNTYSLSTMFGKKQCSCVFLTGFIKGILSQAQQLAIHNVTEEDCCAKGDKHCFFSVKNQK